MAEKSVDNVLKSIQVSKKVQFHKLLFGLGIRYVGETVAKKLVAHFKNINSIRNAGFEDLCDVDEIGEKIAISIVDYFSIQSNNKLIDRLITHGLMMHNESTKRLKSSLLDGKKIVISGKFFKVSREELKQLIEDNGGQNISAVSKSTNFLIAGENIGPSKLKKATNLNLEIINENDFLELIKTPKINSDENHPLQGELF